jgi:hypothetical protein
LVDLIQYLILQDVVHSFRDKASGQGYWEFKEIAVCLSVYWWNEGKGGSECEGGPYAVRRGGNIESSAAVSMV